MKDNQKRDEYVAKMNAARAEYRKEYSEFMERRKKYVGLDSCVAEEQKIRKRYSDRLEEITREYSE